MEDYPKLTLTPQTTPGRSELTRELVLKYTMKVGRAVSNKVKPALDNAIFESKVLSRSHAEIWADSNRTPSLGHRAGRSSNAPVTNC